MIFLLVLSRSRAGSFIRPARGPVVKYKFTEMIPATCWFTYLTCPWTGRDIYFDLLVDWLHLLKYFVFALC